MSRHFISSLLELVRAKSVADQSWHLDLVIRSEIGGGRQSTASLDEIANHPEATALTLSGLDQSSFEYLVARYGAQFSGLHFWKCPRIADLSPLEDLPQLTHVAFFWNQRASRLWDFRKTPKLSGLDFDDFTRLKNLEDLEAARSLTELGFGNAVWRKLEVETLDPLATLKGLRRLVFNAKRILDDRIQPLAKLVDLESLSFPSNIFSTEQLAWLRARLPSTVECPALSAFWTLKSPISLRGKLLDILVMGKGKPYLNSETTRRIAVEESANLRRAERGKTARGFGEDGAKMRTRVHIGKDEDLPQPP